MADTDLQAKLLKEAIEAAEKKRKLEEEIKTVDARSTSFLESAARRDIEAYKKRALAQKMEIN